MICTLLHKTQPARILPSTRTSYTAQYLPKRHSSQQLIHICHITLTHHTPNQLEPVQTRISHSLPFRRLEPACSSSLTCLVASFLSVDCFAQSHCPALRKSAGVSLSPFRPTADRGHRGYKKLGAAATNNLEPIPHAHSEPRSASRRPSLSAELHPFGTTYPKTLIAASLINRPFPKLQATSLWVWITSTHQLHHDDHNDNLGRFARDWRFVARASRGYAYPMMI